MSLIGALNIGKSALAAHQAAIQVTSNNVANAGNPDYTRQVARLEPGFEQQIKPGVFVGSGVNLTAIGRQIDDSLEGRLRGSVSDSESAKVKQEFLGRVEGVFNSLGDNPLSSQLSAFFNSWSDLANKPQDIGLRQIVVQNGDSLASSIRGLRSDLDGVQSDIDSRLGGLTRDANSLAQQVADLNGQISTAEAGGGGSANSLRDQRDAVLKQLAQLVDIKTQDVGNGVVNVLAGSEPLVQGTENRGLGFKLESENGTTTPTLFIKADGGTVNFSSGQIGGLLSLRTDGGGVSKQLDQLAGGLIFELNKLHAAGQGLQGLSQVTAENAVKDTGAALNSSDAGLAFPPSNGSFVIHVKQKGTGLTTSTLVQVNLDGLNGDDTTLDSLKSDIDAIGGVSASIAGGKLSIKADSNDVEIGFSQDSSGVLASLGINSFFSGTDAGDIDVADSIQNNPSLLAAAKNGQAGDNQTAQAIADLESQSISSLGGATLKDSYDSMINGIAVSTASAKTSADAADAVQETLSTQREALSGVSLDEEAINLIREQRAFQGAARVIAAVDEMMKTLLAL